jgi:hypothetical protein
MADPRRGEDLATPFGAGPRTMGSMGWFILILVLLAAAFGVLGAVVKAAAFLVLTILLTLAALGAIAWYSFRAQLRRWEREGAGPLIRTWSWGHRGDDGPRDLPSHDDRY